jgi:nickel-dependent lactate racemase
MARRTVSVSWGKECRELEVEESFLAWEPLSPCKITVPERDPHEVIREALEAPITGPRLRDMVAGRRVCVVVSDDFRAGLQVEIGRCLLAEIASSPVKPEKVWIVSATGSHNPDVYAKRILTALGEAAQKIGLPAELVWHDCDTSAFVEVGSTPLGSLLRVEKAYMQADVRVYGHESKHHYMAGYSCVDKQVVPGVSMRATIEQNHKNSLDEDSRAGNISYHPDPRRQRNPFSADARAARNLLDGYVLADDGALVERGVASFCVDMISEKDTILWIKAGQVEDVSKLMPAEADKVGAYEVQKQRYVLISPGGPPACQALYGTQNCFDLALLGAIKQGGEALILSPCNGRPDLPPDVSGIAPDRKAKELFYDCLVELLPKSLQECEEYIRDHFELYLWKTIRMIRLTKKYGLTLYLHSELPDDVVLKAGMTPVHDPQAWIDERAARGDGGRLLVIDNGNKLFVSGHD